MIELPLIFLAGLLGSSHCVGMCGGFALMLGLNSKTPWRNLGAQLIYSSGRIFTYTVLGCAAGYFGGQLNRDWSLWVNVSAVLSLVAGAFLIYQGLLAAGVALWNKRPATTSTGGCLTAPIFKTFLMSTSITQRFLAGVVTGFLPCGLLYGALALAAASGNLLTGGITMALFGLGTVPLMVLTGVGGNLLSLTARTKLLRAAAWCVVITGTLTMARGAGFVSIPGQSAPAGCPMCTEQEKSSLFPPTLKTSADRIIDENAH